MVKDSETIKDAWNIGKIHFEYVRPECRSRKGRRQKRKRSNILPISMVQLFSVFFSFLFVQIFPHGQVDRLFQLDHGAISPSLMVLLVFMHMNIDLIVSENMNIDCPTSDERASWLSSVEWDDPSLGRVEFSVRLGTVGKSESGVLGPWTIWTTMLLVGLVWTGGCLSSKLYGGLLWAFMVCKSFGNLGTWGSSDMGLLGRVNRGKGRRVGSSSGGGSRMWKMSSWWTRLLKMSTRWLLLQEPALMRRRFKKCFQRKGRFILLVMEGTSSGNSRIL